MPVTALYDDATGLVAAIIDTDARPQRRNTGAPITGTPRQLPLESHYPDPYLPDFPELLGASVMRLDAERQVVVRTWPVANFTPDALRGVLQERLTETARQALSLTDWAVLRMLETGKAIPAGIVQERATLRTWHDVRGAALELAGPAELLAYDLTPPVGRMAVQAGDGPAMGVRADLAEQAEAEQPADDGAAAIPDGSAPSSEPEATDGSDSPAPLDASVSVSTATGPPDPEPEGAGASVNLTATAVAGPAREQE